MIRCNSKALLTYFQPLFVTFEREPIIWMGKSGDMMVSFACVARPPGHDNSKVRRSLSRPRRKIRPLRWLSTRDLFGTDRPRMIGADLVGTRDPIGGKEIYRSIKVH